jgi:hypothetical protein
MEGPRVEGDSIIGRAPNSSAQLGVARGDMRSVEVRHISRGRTAAVGLVLLALYEAAAYLYIEAEPY